MTTPAVRTIRENFPDSEISMLVLPWVSDVFRFSPHVDQLIIYDKKGPHKGIVGKWRLGRELAARNFDCAILLQNAFEAAFITTVAQIPMRCGYTTDGRGVLLTHGVKKAADIGTRHQVHYYQEMVAGLGLSAGSDELEIVLPAQKLEEAAQRVGSGSMGKGPLVGLNPGAAYGPAKRWPAEKYAELGARLVHEMGARVAVFGTDADNEAAELVKTVSGTPQNIFDFTGKTTLVEAMALIKQCDGFVTNDSGLMHVAAALQVPLAAVFGSTDHIATGPFSKRAVVIRKDIECSPCKQTHCPKKHLNCLRNITVDEVFTQVIRLLT